VTIGSVANPGQNFENAIIIYGANGNAGINLQQRIESHNIYDLAGSTVTFSVYLASNSLPYIYWQANGPSSTDTWSGDYTFINQGTFTINPTLNRYSVQVALPIQCTQGLMFQLFTNPLASGVNLTVTGAQVEIGSTPNPFERRPIGLELAVCQRYYFYMPSSWYLNGYAGAASQNATSTFTFPSTMRTTPTVVLNSSGPVNCSVSAVAVTNTWATVGITATAAGPMYAAFSPTASAEL
jgi:hypothetical protein